MHFYNVSLKNVPQLLTYQSPTPIPIGSLVEVKLGKRDVNGVIWKEAEQPEYDCVEIKKIHIKEALSPLQIELCQWMSSYYFASLQRCVQLFLPSPIWNQRIKPKKEQFLELAVDPEKALKKTKTAKKQSELINFFVQEQSQKQEETYIKKNFSTSIIKSVLEKGLLKQTEGELINPDTEHHSKPYHDQPLTTEQQEVLKSILNTGNQRQRSLRQTEERKNERTNKEVHMSMSSSVHKSISPSVHTFLLHGVTGSGKTEIYLQLIKKSIAEGKQTVLLVPEIALTTELIQYFSDHFPDQISIIHSKLSERDRVQAWHRIHTGKTKLILGSRSALFTPWKNLGNLIIDEEHEWTYKQESSPRYHVKKVAEKIIQLIQTEGEEACPEQGRRALPRRGQQTTLLLGSATPSLESYFECAHSGEVQQPRLLNLTKRATPYPLPPVHIVDLRQEYLKKNFSMYSEELQEAIQERLDKREQIILFLNKRGSSSSITCRDCGYTPLCKNCDISLTHHSKLKEFQNGGLICHYCGVFRENISICPECESAAIRYLGTGTQKAEQQLTELFPEANILRADKDSTGGKNDFEKIYHQMKDGKADVLLGTQMITKGLDLPNVTLTGILLADIGLHIPDFRASERVFQLLTQVAGRSGRHKPGQVIIQSYQPEHPAIQAAKTHDYVGFYKQEMKIREQHFYSPFSNSIKLIFAHENAKKAADEALSLYGKLSDKIQDQRKPHQTKERINERTEEQLIVPHGQNSSSVHRSIRSSVTKQEQLPQHYSTTVEIAPNYIPRLHGKYTWNILLRGENPRTILKQISLPTGWKIDVDPR